MYPPRKPIQQAYLAETVEISRVQECAEAMKFWLEMAQQRRTLTDAEVALQSSIYTFLDSFPSIKSA